MQSILLRHFRRCAQDLINVIVKLSSDSRHLSSSSDVEAGILHVRQEFLSSRLNILHYCKIASYALPEFWLYLRT